MSMATLTVPGCQINIPLTCTAGDRDAHVVRVTGRIDELLAQCPADLVVMPELSTIDYSRDSFVAYR